METEKKLEKKEKNEKQNINFWFAKKKSFDYYYLKIRDFIPSMIFNMQKTDIEVVHTIQYTHYI